MNKIWMTIAGVALLLFFAKALLGSSKGNVMLAKEKIKLGALVLDVRTKREFQGGHYEGAINIPVQELESRLGELTDKRRARVVYCASGMRSAQAVKILTKAGFSEVIDAGGLGNLQ